MKKTTFFIAILLYLLTISCKNKSSSNSNRIKHLDSIKTTELLKQISKDEKKNYLAPNCITEKPRATFTTINVSNKSIKKLLNIKDSIHYKFQLESYKKFRITQDLFPDKNILTEAQFKEFKKKSKENRFSFWDWMDKNCKSGYCSISKPIFNETYDLAFVKIGIVCGGLCGGGEGRIYEFKNGKWHVKSVIGSWVS